MHIVRMKVAPFFQYKSISQEELMEYECSDRIIVCQNATLLQEYESNGKFFLIRISNSLGESVAGALYNVHDDTDVIYVPTWMLHMLHLTTNVTLSRITEHPCAKICIQPHDDTFVKNPLWIPQLNQALHSYITLSPQATILLNIEGAVVKVTVISLDATYHGTCFVHNGNTIDIQVMQPSVHAPLKSAAPTKADTTDETDDANIPFLYSNPRRKPRRYKHAFSGVGYASGGFMPPRENTPICMAHKAALQRLHPLPKGVRTIAPGMVYIAPMPLHIQNEVLTQEEPPIQKKVVPQAAPSEHSYVTYNPREIRPYPDAFSGTAHTLDSGAQTDATVLPREMAYKAACKRMFDRWSKK